jgi:predicted enzyme related to lactoylglutathione lyase
MTTYTPGTPSWVDLASTDIEASKRFYGELFGWDSRVAKEPEAQGYTTFLKDGKAVAAVGGQMDPSMPTTWTTYFATADVDDTVSKVDAAGGKVLLPPLDVMGYGKMAVFADPGGATFAVWQEGTMPGAELRGEAGSFGWAELMTRDPGSAKTFYPSALGLTARDIAYAEGVYTLWEVGGKAEAGMYQVTADEPPRWMVYFNVDDPDAVVAKVEQLGGVVAVPPTDTPAGRFASIGDPQGAYFSVIKPDPDYRP